MSTDENVCGGIIWLDGVNSIYVGSLASIKVKGVN